MRALRYIPPGSLVEVTGRTFQSRLLLRPSPLLNEILLGALGRAQQRYRVALHGFVVLSNHYHLLVTADSPLQLARFVCYFQSKVAREVARLTGWRQKIWGRRYQAIHVSSEEPAQVQRLIYLLRHGVKEGLVASPRQWPGVHFAQCGPTGSLQGTWFDRTQEYWARSRGESFSPRTFATAETVILTPIPAWTHRTEEEVGTLFEEMLGEVEASGLRLREESGREPLGVTAILRQHPHEQPARSKRSPAPRVHAASKAVRTTLRLAYGAFLRAYREASCRLREGLPVTFPAHCFVPPSPWLEPGRHFGPVLCASP